MAFTFASPTVWMDGCCWLAETATPLRSAGQNGKPRQERIQGRFRSWLTEKDPFKGIATIFLSADSMVIEMCSPRMFWFLVFLFFSFESADYPFLMHHCHHGISVSLFPLPPIFSFLVIQLHCSSVSQTCDQLQYLQAESLNGTIE